MRRCVATGEQLPKKELLRVVRTPEGTAYEADVQVSDMSANNKHMMAIAIDVQETGLTKEFALPTPFDLEEEEE